jgi:hypothetical protein
MLREKYLDYCSAQLADLLLYLSPDEIYVLAERVSADDLPYDQRVYSRIVEVATRWLADSVMLPPFEVWARDYAAHPERYEAYFMGLWESEVPVRGH